MTADLDYFFYEARCDAITSFVRETTERLRRLRPRIEISAAVFTNPMLSGRFIGQRWTDFGEWVDIIAPMNYRSHFQGSFDDFLAYLSDYLHFQKEWTRGKLLVPGITGYYIYREEQVPWERALSFLEKRPGAPTPEEFEQVMMKNINIVSSLDRARGRELENLWKQYRAARDEQAKEKTGKALREAIRALLTYPPPALFPPEKFLRTLQTVRQAGADGVAVFAAGIIQRNKLWEALRIGLAD